MSTPNDLPAALDLAPHISEHLAELFRNCMTRRIRQIDNTCTSPDYLSADLGHEIPVTARGVFTRKLDVIQILLGARDSPRRRVQNVFTSHRKFVFQVNVGGGDKNMNPGAPGFFDRPEGLINVFLAGAGKAQYDRV